LRLFPINFNKSLNEQLIRSNYSAGYQLSEFRSQESGFRMYYSGNILRIIKSTDFFLGY